MKTKISNLWTRILVVLLGVLGFACGDSDDNVVPEKFNGDKYGPCLYGSPNATFKIVGTVTDQDKNPVAEAKIVVYPHFYPDTTLTAEDGSFTIKSENMGENPLSIVTFKDGYSRDSVALDLVFKDGDNSWYIGNCDTTYNPVISKIPESDKKDSDNTENEETH